MEHSDILLALGAEIRRLRSGLDMSQDDFADTIAMHRAQYSKIERGEQNMTVATLVKVARGLGVTLSGLVTAAGV